MDKSQIYKIYINEVEVILKPSADVTLEDTVTSGSVVVKYTGNKKHLLDYISILEKSIKSEKLIIHHEDFPKTYCISYAHHLANSLHLTSLEPRSCLLPETHPTLRYF